MRVFGSGNEVAGGSWRQSVIVVLLRAIKGREVKGGFVGKKNADVCCWI